MARTKQTARQSTGGNAPPRNPNRQVARKSAPARGVEVNSEDSPTRTEIRTDLEQFGTIDYSEPIELPHGARQVQTTVDTATAFFDIRLSDLSDFDNITRGRFARHQISEPFEIAGLWWVLGIEKKAQFNSSRSQICAHLFCISLQHRLSASRVRSFPLRWKIHRGDQKGGQARTIYMKLKRRKKERGKNRDHFRSTSSSHR